MKLLNLAKLVSFLDCLSSKLLFNSQAMFSVGSHEAKQC